MQTERERVHDQFLKDTADHQLEILLDQGVYRHLKFSKGGSFVYRFDLVTWPGYLAVSGDMGEWVFQRLEDMFQFFRTDAGKINASYWGEKCQAADRNGGLKSFDEAKARAGVAERVREAYEDKPDLLADALGEADRDIKFHDGEVRFYDSCRDFKGPGDLIPFYDHESIPDPMEWSYHYLWICHAIVMGIQKYDEAKAVQVAA